LVGGHCASELRHFLLAPIREAADRKPGGQRYGLRKIIPAMGGELEIRDILPAGVVRINQFQDVRRS